MRGISGEDIRFAVEHSQQERLTRLESIDSEEMKQMTVPQMENVIKILTTRLKELQGTNSGDPEGTIMGSGEMGQDEKSQRKKCNEMATVLGTSGALAKAYERSLKTFPYPK